MGVEEKTHGCPKLFIPPEEMCTGSRSIHPDFNVDESFGRLPPDQCFNTYAYFLW